MGYVVKRLGNLCIPNFGTILIPSSLLMHIEEITSSYFARLREEDRIIALTPQFFCRHSLPHLVLEPVAFASCFESGHVKDVVQSRKQYTSSRELRLSGLGNVPLHLKYELLEVVGRV